MMALAIARARYCAHARNHRNQPIKWGSGDRERTPKKLQSKHQKYVDFDWNIEIYIRITSDCAFRGRESIHEKKTTLSRAKNTQSMDTHECLTEKDSEKKPTNIQKRSKVSAQSMYLMYKR